MNSHAFFRNRRAGLSVALAALIMATTATLFIVLKPGHASSNYWLALGDMLAMQFIFACAAHSNASLAGRGDAERLPTAMRISMGTTLGIFWVGGSILSVLFAAVPELTERNDSLFLIILVVKWLGLLVAVAAMRFAGEEGLETVQVREDSRKNRAACAALLQRSFNDLKDVSLSGPSAQAQRRVVDHLEMTCNQLKALVSGTPEKAEANSKIEELVNTLVQGVSSLGSAPADQHATLLVQLEQISRDLSFEVKNNARHSSSGLA